MLTLGQVRLLGGPNAYPFVSVIASYSKVLFKSLRETCLFVIENSGKFH